jgi:hypothetical protein
MTAPTPETHVVVRGSYAREPGAREEHRRAFMANGGSAEDFDTWWAEGHIGGVFVMAPLDGDRLVARAGVATHRKA